MITTEESILSCPTGPDGRFQVAGTLLALAEIVVIRKADGEEEERTSYLLRSLADVVALHGIEYARGWLQGFDYATGVRDFDTKVAARKILG